MLQAEELLEDATRLVDSLSLPLPDSERSNGWTDDLRKAMESVLKRVCERLRVGEYLRRSDFAAWDELLDGAGFSRRVLTGISYVDADRKRLGLNVDFIETGPEGGWWDRVREFDSHFVNFAGMDLSEHRGRF